MTKVFKTIVFFIVLLSVISITSYLLKGESSDSSVITDKAKVETSNIKTDERIVREIQDEINEMRDVKTEGLPSESPYFNTEVVIRDFSNGRVDFEIHLDNAKTIMNSVVISALLDEKILNYLNTPNSLITNLLTVQDTMDKDFGENFNIGPNSDIKGITASSNMIYFEGKTLDDLLKIIPYILIKFSWIDEKEVTHTEFIKYPKEKFIIKTK